jgi:cytidine deaminase
MNKLSFSIDYEAYNGIEELSATDQMLCEKAKSAMASSHSPYSKFKVGTAVLLADGQIVLGSNQENVAYPSGLCAERVALFTIGANYHGAVIKAMAITAATDNFKIENPVTSCGGCLQTMAEYEQLQNEPIEVLFYCIDGKIIKVKGVKNLLPFGFVEDRLGS